MPSTAVLFSPPVVPVSDTEATLAVTVSETSASFTVSVPLFVRAELVSIREAAALSLVTRWISGLSLVPVN